jgi:serine/threonine protein kinase/tetratricopeptide (TPR) repeat protein
MPPAEGPWTHPDLPSVAAALSHQFAFQREIGRGGAAVVFLAKDLRTAQPIAVKVLRPELSAAVGAVRFQREIEIARSLRHPNVLQLLESGISEGQLYYTMPFVSGETLRERIRRERQLALADVLVIARDVANALDHAHAAGLVHRDIKPGNILLDQKRALVADFGIARAMTVASGQEITDSGVAIGTPEYMSPEQGTGTRELDARSDVYALGCVVYEMLAGEPPFTGPTSQAIIARHCSELPHSLRIIRPAIPIGVERAVESALAKVPADRFATAGAFVDALEAGAVSGERPLPLARRSLMAGVILGVVLVAIAGVSAWYALHRRPSFDRNRIVVFPLHDPSAPSGSEESGEAVATFIGYALDGTRPLKWLDGWELLDPRRSSGRRLEVSEARRLSRSVNAGFYIDGSVVRHPDSVTVMLTAYSLSGDSVVRRVRQSGTSSASLPQLGLRAVGQLLPILVAPGGRIDLSALSERSPTAVANFLQGERAYRRMQFRAALPHYESVLREDSAFALAALRGAQAANWLSEFGTDVRLAELALKQVAVLSPAQSLLARGLHAYLTGAADSSVVYLRRALASDSALHEGWTLLGEVYLHMLPDASPADSLARYAFERARRADRDFAPTLLLLEEMALRAGDVKEANALGEELRKAGADTTHALSRELMLRCVRDGPGSIDWHAAVRRDERSVVSSAKLLAGGAAQPDCAIAAFRTLLEAEGVTVNSRWASLLGIETLFGATGRPAEARDVVTWKGTAGLPIGMIFLLVASAGSGFEHEAGVVADSMSTAYDRLSAPRLWAAGTWEAKRKNIARVRSIAAVLRRQADSSGSRTTQLLRRSIDARLTLLEGDSTGALQMLRALSPSAPRGDIAWQPWEALAPERMTLGELLFNTGDFAEAIRVASQFDAVEPISYPLYLRQSLELRRRAAEAMRNSPLSSIYGHRLSRLAAQLSPNPRVP